MSGIIRVDGSVYDLIHADKYRGPNENFREACNRQASALQDSAGHYDAYRHILLNEMFLPGGRIQSAIGSTRITTAYNCLSGDTKILTKEYGAIAIDKVVGQEVTLLDGNRNWVLCKIYDHGIQETYELEFKGSCQNFKIRSTLEHGWVAANTGTILLTKAFTHEAGNREIADLRPSKQVSDAQDYQKGVIHGLIYGDSSYQYDRDKAIQYRVCSAHAEIYPLLESIPYSTPPRSQGDRHYYISNKKAWGYLKEFPDSFTPDYLLGFLRGWFAADGCLSTFAEPTLCGDAKEMEWLTQWGPLVGWHIANGTLLAKQTNFGIRKKQSLNIPIIKSSLNLEDFLLTKHRTRWEKRGSKNNRSWRIHGKIHDPRKERVYCPVVPTTHSFALANGIHSRNCFVSGSIEDSFVEGHGSIMNRAKEAAATMRLGGGIGYDFSPLRPYGALIKKLQSSTSGPLAFMNIFDALCSCVSSAGHRRGAQMGVLRVDHPDIERFIHAKQNGTALRNFNISVAVTDLFMKALKSGATFDLKFEGEVYRSVNPVSLWDMLMRSTWDWADPGVLFIDRINEWNNLWYCETIAGTNPCLVEGTLVQTPNGLVPVEEIKVNDPISTIAGVGLVQSIEKHENIPVFKVTFSDGSELVATEAHIFHVVEGKWFNKEKSLKHLKPGDRVRVSGGQIPNNTIQNPTGRTDREYGFLIGLTIGDGCFTEKTKGFKVASGAQDREWNKILVDFFIKLGAKTVRQDLCKNNSSLSICPSVEIRDMLINSPLSRGYSHTKYLPLELVNSNKDFLVGFLDGLVSSDGNIHMSKDNPMIRVSTSSKNNATMLKRVLNMFGIHAKMYNSGKKGKSTVVENRVVPFNHETYVVCILGCGIKTFAEHVVLTHPAKQARLYELTSSYNLTGHMWTTTIKKIEPAGVARVYDLFEPVSDTWITEGIVNRGCGEQPLPPYGACLLGSFNLVRFLKHTGSKFGFDWDLFKGAIPHVVRAMDNIIDRTLYPLHEQEMEAKNKRRMGLGVTGLANTLEALGFPYGTEDFLKMQATILECLRNHTYQSSIDLAKEKGHFKKLHKGKYLRGKFIQTLPDDIRNGIEQYGIRNSHLLSIAPTGTISLSAGNVSSGIEPVIEYEYNREIITPQGPQNFTLSDFGYRELGVKGKRIPDIRVDDHINVLTTAQRYVDSAVSKTCNIPKGYDWNDFKGVYLKAYEGGAKGCTTYREGGKRESIFSSSDEGNSCSIDESGRRNCE